MPDLAFDPEDFPIRLETDHTADNLFLTAATVEEGLSKISTITVEFVCTNRALDLDKLVGTKMRVVLDAPSSPKRVFPGTCVSLEFLGTETGSAHFCAEIRPWMWFLTRTRDCFIFQQKSVPDIIKEILQKEKYGFSGDMVTKLKGTYDKRDYVVQYRETDYDFLCRLMEEEGIYFFFKSEGDTEKLVLADDVGSHEAVAGDKAIVFQDRSANFNRQLAHIYDWKSRERVTSGKVTLKDYDFETPTSEMKSATVIPKGTHDNKDHEIYDYPGHYRATKVGDKRARVRTEAEAVRHKTATALANATTLGVGMTFALDEHPRKAENIERMVTRAVHKFQLVGSDAPPLGVTSILTGALEDLTQNSDPYQVAFESIPADEPYRAPLVTPWPEIPGVHTAIVVGPKGDEIYTDKYGRIKVQFHWDRVGKKDKESSCWVRTMMPWTGKNWGMISIPRIGQEVVIQFEEGDPDRPVCIGMLYNGDTMPPYELPANMTQSGIKTNTSKKGGGFNELMFEDKKDSELVRFQSERDYEQIIKNNATVTVGLEHKDKGDMDVTVHRHLTETLKTGDHTFKIATGSQKIDIKKDKKETIEGKSDLIITKDVTETIKMGNLTRSVDQGNVTETIKMGNAERTLDMGNEKTTLKMGNQTIDVKLGKIDSKAMQGITLTCGSSSIKIDPMGVTIKGPMIKIEASGILQAKGAMTKIESQLLILKGSLTMIN
jgi:type VI secretion system secreted protein VgrG